MTGTHLRILDGRLEQLLEVLVALLVLVARLPPLRNSLAVEDQDVEEGVEEEDDVRLDRDAVQQHGLWWCVERVRHKCGLNHDQRVVHVLFVQDMAVEWLDASIFNDTTLLTGRTRSHPDYC